MNIIVVSKQVTLVERTSIPYSNTSFFLLKSVYICICLCIKNKNEYK